MSAYRAPPVSTDVAIDSDVLSIDLVDFPLFWQQFLDDVSDETKNELREKSMAELQSLDQRQRCRVYCSVSLAFGTKKTGHLGLELGLDMELEFAPSRGRGLFDISLSHRTNANPSGTKSKGKGKREKGKAKKPTPTTRGND